MCFKVAWAPLAKVSMAERWHNGRKKGGQSRGSKQVDGIFYSNALTDIEVSHVWEGFFGGAFGSGVAWGR